VREELAADEHVEKGDEVGEAEARLQRLLVQAWSPRLQILEQHVLEQILVQTVADLLVLFPLPLLPALLPEPHELDAASALPTGAPLDLLVDAHGSERAQRPLFRRGLEGCGRRVSLDAGRVERVVVFVQLHLFPVEAV